ncbi:MAG: alpha/beta hydrolase [Lachnospiraceae bacterium]|nr:alpha/beta hydrolase [Lachnospiraceae bacterium]
MDAQFIEKPFELLKSGLTLRGIAYIPGDIEEYGKVPAIIFSHGFTGSCMDMAKYCKAFVKKGYAAFTFNFCGSSKIGDHSLFRSDGETVDTSILTEVDDLLCVKDYVKSLPYVEQDNLILAGESQGGFVSGLAAARCPDEIKKLIMIYPALCIPDHARRGCLGNASYDPKNVPDVIDCKNILLGKVFHDTVVAMDPYLEISGYKGPVLILQGMDDRIVNYSYAIRMKESFQPGQCHLQLIRGAGHGFNEDQMESAVSSIYQFLLGHKEVLTIPIIITEYEIAEQDGDYKKMAIWFTGYCDNDYFRGAVLPGGCDRQEHRGDKTLSIRAEYTLHGLDCAGKNCTIHIINQKAGDEWKPSVATNSEALGWMNTADFTAVVEPGVGGPTIRIYR